MNITHEMIAQHILSAIDAGTLVQGRWGGRDADGREITSLLGPIHPSASGWDAGVMPNWMRYMATVLFDSLPPKSVAPTARRFAGLIVRWRSLRPAQWDEVLNHVLVRAIDDAQARASAARRGYWRPADNAKAALMTDVGTAAEAWRRCWQACADAGEASAAARQTADVTALVARLIAARATAREMPASDARVSGYDAAVWTAQVLAAKAAALMAARAGGESLFGFLCDQIEAQIDRR